MVTYTQQVASRASTPTSPKTKSQCCNIKTLSLTHSLSSFLFLLLSALLVKAIHSVIMQQRTLLLHYESISHD